MSTLRRPRRRTALLAAAAATLLVVRAVAAGVALSRPSSEPDRHLTLVSLTFDDGSASQLEAAEILERHGLRATFFVPSGLLGRPGQLTPDHVRGLHAAGHEIGGHSLTHPNLRRLDEPQQRRQVCEDRRRLLRLATPVRSFAYPYDSRDAVTRRLVGECGYTSGRAVGGLRTGGPDDPCAQCPGAERLPASDPLVTRTPLAVRETWTLADLQRVVLAAERTGGWTQLVLHRVCDGCHLGVNPALLDRFAAWLARRADSHDTRVLPVGDVVTGPWWTHDDR